MRETDNLIIRKPRRNINRTEVTFKSCLIMLCIIGTVGIGIVIFMKVHTQKHTNSTLN